MTDIPTLARRLWLADHKPIYLSLPYQEQPDKFTEREHPHVWASALGSCCWAHACKRHNVAPLLPQLAAHSDDLLTLFHYGTMVEQMWLSIFQHYYNHADRILIGQRFTSGARLDGSRHGVSGYLDGLIQRWDVLIPIEIKFSADFTIKPAQFSQITAYMHEMDVPEGWLIVSHVDGTFTSGRVQQTEGVYRLYDMHTNQLYLSYRQPFVETVPQVAERIAAHQVAYQILPHAMTLERPYRHNAACLPAPFFSQCLAVGPDKVSVVPRCPWFCWDDDPQTSYPYANKIASIRGNMYRVYGGR